MVKREQAAAAGLGVKVKLSLLLCRKLVKLVGMARMDQIDAGHENSEIGDCWTVRAVPEESRRPLTAIEIRQKAIRTYLEIGRRRRVEENDVMRRETVQWCSTLIARHQPGRVGKRRGRVTLVS